MKNAMYIYKSGTLQRKDNTLRIVTDDGTKKDWPIE